MEINKLLNTGSNHLKNSNIFTHKLDSEILLSKILNQTREELLINLDKKVSLKNIKQFNKLIKRRSNREPIAYILRKKEFWSKNFVVNKNTLIPRPETELMVEKIVNIFQNKKPFILDIGTGSGCILISILSELKEALGIGVDISNNGIKIAIKNSKKHQLSNKIRFYRKSFTQIFNYKFDLIVSNPPYIVSNDMRNLEDDIKKFEPKLALDGGNDGLDVIKKVIYKSKYILKINGMLALEIGNKQHKKVSQILEKENFRVVDLIKDYKSNVRCIISKLKH